MGGVKSRTKILCLIGVLSLAGAVWATGAHAQLKYKSEQVVKFTFNSSLSLNVSGDLSVDNMTAGSNADSNEITIAVNTNSFNGYYLTATAGASNTNTDLVNTTNNNYVFSSLATNASIANMASASNNTWGYKFRIGSGSYSNYSGLPLDGNDYGETGAVLVNTTDPADSKTVGFKIGAKAAPSQPPGVYTNTINFFAVAFPVSSEKTIVDLEYLQDFATLSSEDKATVLESMAPDQQYSLKDSRDQKTYYISKLADGNVWMTENLDLDLETTPTNVTALTSDNTNLKLYGSYGYDSSNGYSCSNASATCENGVITWTPERATSTVLSSWINDNNNP